MFVMLGIEPAGQLYQPQRWTNLYTEIACNYAFAAVIGQGKVLHHPRCTQLFFDSNRYAMNIHVASPSLAASKRYRFPARQGCCYKLWSEDQRDQTDL